MSIAAQTFKAGSPALKALEQTHLFGEGLKVREEQEGDELLDLDSDESSEACRTYLCSVESLMCSLGLVLSPRSYREDFSNSYKALYLQMLERFGSKAAYLPEILDSA